jgi:ABC-type multidrug transport system fused ATPase/permease subunit
MRSIWRPVASFYALLSPSGRWHLAGVLALGFLASALDLAGIAFVTIFMGRLGAAHPPLRMALVAGLALLVSSLAHLGALWMEARFAWATERDLGTRLLSRYLRMPYAWFLGRQRTVLAHDVLGDSVAIGIILPIIAMAHRLVTVGLLSAALLHVDASIAGAALVLISGAYGLLVLVTRTPTARWGSLQHEARRARMRVALETLEGMKTVRLHNAENAFLAAYETASRNAGEAAFRLRALAFSPRYFLEAFAFAAFILLAMYLSWHGRAADVLPMLGLYALAAYRIIPAVHDFFSSLTLFRAHEPTLDILSAGLAGEVAAPPPASPIPPDWDAIRVRDVRYAYADAEVLRGVDLDIPRHAVIGIVGTTGAGKSTLLDLLLGLLEPVRGRVEIGGVALEAGNVRAWYRQVGYVTQDGILVDASILHNIAFGIPETAIDPKAAERAAQTAGLADFIAHDLPEGYATRIGERGVRLSAGQRQRLVLARALYTDPEVLVLDEVTSHLDGVTERVVMDAVAALAGRKTIVLVTHRLSTARRCERLYVLEGGRVAAHGTVDELLEGSALFAEMMSPTSTVSPRST